MSFSFCKDDTSGPLTRLRIPRKQAVAPKYQREVQIEHEGIPITSSQRLEPLRSEIKNEPMAKQPQVFSKGSAFGNQNRWVCTDSEQCIQPVAGSSRIGRKGKKKKLNHLQLERASLRRQCDVPRHNQLRSHPRSPTLPVPRGFSLYESCCLIQDFHLQYLT